MDTNVVAALGKTIAKARKKAGLSQEALAASIEKSPRVVQYYEAGKTLPGHETLFHIAQATGTHPIEFIEPMYQCWLDTLAVSAKQ